MDYAPRPRWTGRRIGNTLWYAVVGAAIGILLSAIVLMLTFVVGRISPFLPVVLVLALAPIARWVVFRGSMGTCQRHPTAPAGIAVGLSAGAIAAICFLVIANRSRVMPLDYMITAGILGIINASGGYLGGVRGLQANLGPRRIGIGRTCAACGYDLSGTPQDWECPECGGKERFERAPSEGA